MNDNIVMWLFGPVLAVGSFIVTCAALFYAHLAYRSSVKSAEQARAAELTSLRIQAKTGLDDAQRSLIALKTDCQANRAEWQRYERQLPPLRSQSMINLWPDAEVVALAHNMLDKLVQSYDAVDTMTPSELEELLQEARTTSMKVLALAGELEAPPNQLR